MVGFLVPAHRFVVIWCTNTFVRLGLYGTFYGFCFFLGAIFVNQFVTIIMAEFTLHLLRSDRNLV